MKIQKKIVLVFIGLLLAINAVYFIGALGSVEQFAKSVYSSRKAASLDENYKFLEIYKDFNPLNPPAELSHLSRDSLLSLRDEGEYFHAYKLDANIFSITYYRLENRDVQGFTGRFELDSSRLWGHYALLLASLLAIGAALLLYRKFCAELSAADNKCAQLQKKLSKEQKNSMVDLTTGLGNKASLVRAINAANTPKIILADVLDFRKITDYFDSLSSDDLLRQLAFFFSQFAQQKNFELFYIDGEQFAFLQDSDEDLDYYEEIITELISMVKQQEFRISFEDNSFDIVLSITLGLCLESEHVLRKAQIALARAKAEYKNFVCYAKYLSDEKSYLETLSTAKNIKDAVSNNEILPFFQPIYDREGKISKYESLVRIVKKTPEGTVVLTPQSFLAISVKMKQYEQIEGFIINKVIQTLQERPEISLSINLSARDMGDSVQNARFLSKVRSAGVAERLIIEVLEDEDISQNMRIKDFLRRAKDLGCKIAIDDFGSGFSNFSYLLELMPHFIKIDGSIVGKICTDEKSLNILKTIVLFSKSLGIKTVAEYVASKEIYDMCYEIGVDEFQGFYLGKPSPGFTPEEIDLDFYKLGNN